MTFSDACKFLNEHESLLGEKINGATVDELLIVPCDYEKLLFEQYVDCLDAKIALARVLQFHNILHNELEYIVYAICDKRRIQRDGVLLKYNITNEYCHEM